MPETIEKHYVMAFGRNLQHAPQTKMAKLINCVSSDINFTEPGTSYTDKLLGKSDPQPVTNRHGDTPSKEIDRGNRGGFFYPYEDANWLGKLDNARQLDDPANDIVEAMQFGIRRSRDNFIINTIFGTTREGAALENGLAWSGTPLAVNLGGNNLLNVTKLREAAANLDNGEVEGERYFIAGVSDKKNLLSATETTSSDYNTVKALVNGQIDEFLGFKFVWFPDARILVNGSAQRRCAAFVKPAVVYKSRPIIGDGGDGGKAKIWERNDKRGDWEAYVCFEQAGHRRYDEGVCEVLTT